MNEGLASDGVSGIPRLLLRLEGLALLLAAGLLYQRVADSWWLFAILFLALDLGMLGYLAGPRIGAIAYNATHTLFVPVALAILGLVLPALLLLQIALVWIAHIGVDRALGMGLKYEAGFGFTHLGRIGRAP
ncbi:MAG: DUF4260 domain-containing protein [Pseudorhodoplanes sp.]|nr:DUF4260 domain-containing protein [Pseudorhodoplanes sp.]